MSNNLEKKIKSYINFSTQCNFDMNANSAERLVNDNPNKVAHVLGGIGSYTVGGTVGSLLGGTLGGQAGYALGGLAGGVGGAYLGWKLWGRKEVNSSKYYAFKLKTDGTFDKSCLLGSKEGYDSKEEAQKVIGDKDNCKVLKGSTLITDYPHLFH